AAEVEVAAGNNSLPPTNAVAPAMARHRISTSPAPTNSIHGGDLPPDPKSAGPSAAGAGAAGRGGGPAGGGLGRSGAALVCSSVAGTSGSPPRVFIIVAAVSLGAGAGRFGFS